MVCVTKEQCVFFVLISVTQVSGLTTFISPYNGTTLKGTVKSSLQFNWAFSVAFGTIEWGFAAAANSKVLSDDGILFTIYPDGTTQATTSAPYEGRVNGSVIRQGLVGFTLRNLRTSDARYFGCRISPLDVSGKKETDTVKVIVEDKPNITHPREASKSFVESSSVSVSCTAKGTVDPGVRWIHDDQVRSFGSGTTNLIFSKINRSDAGIYICRANNSAGVTEKELNVTVNFRVTIKTFTKNSTVTEGNPIKLTCHANGYPVPSIVWKKDGREICAMSVLNIASSNRSDSGRYICIASNTLEKKEMETFVTVNYPAYIKKVSPPSPHESWIAQNVTFVCEANGVPTPTIIWKRPDGTEVERVVGSENVLHLLMQKDGDFGSYLCEANNTVGSVDKHTVQVDQIRPPDAPTITTQDKDIQVESLWVKWTPPIDNGGSNITGYRVIVLQDEKVIINKTTTSDKLQYFVDKGLTKSTNYSLSVSALNKVFEGMAGEKNVMTKYQGAPATAEIIDLPAATKSKKVTIKWNEPQNNGASITLYTVYQRDVKKGDIKGEWIKIREIKDLSRRQVVVSLEKNKVYEFVVTANNSFGESLREGQNIRKLHVLGDIPEPVNIQVQEKDDTVILTWDEPENNGATIIKYSIYTRIVGGEEWKKVANLTGKDAPKIKYILVLVGDCNQRIW
ncbi:neural cell adhesion molecule 2-like isoform X3 [Montipora capricornis]|uniref:neural cell adhesion molecule 2-like isoform X3 n=1 Tax=Montipora capricornis TaxID=246305 RepID=UPI0035F137C3